MAKFWRAFSLFSLCSLSTTPVALTAVALTGAALGGIALGASGCGPSYDDRSIKTADDRLREQEELAYQQELRSRSKPQAMGEVVDEAEKPGVFDDKQADLELRRATRSAETCPEVVTGDKVPSGKTSVTITFALDGAVAEASIPPPYEGTRLGDCVLNAYQAIIVPPYSGERKVITWDVNLEKAKVEKASKKK